MRRFVVLSAAVLALAAGGIAALYGRELAAVRAGLAAAGHVAETTSGPVAYAVFGDGRPALVIHGAGGGYDQGMLIARHFAGEGVRWIAPSRFGYPGSPLPEDASTAAQGDALAALLDALGIESVAVLAFSGGVPPALQLAARHPDRVTALALLSSAPFTPLTAEAQDLPLPAWVYKALFSTDFAYWVLSKLAPARLGAVFDVRADLLAEADTDETLLAAALVRSFLPVTERLAGVANEGAAIDPAAHYPLGRITAPTLVVHARDDGINPFAIGDFAAETIPGARLLVLETGGHLLLGQSGTVRPAVRALFAGVSGD